MISNKKYFCPDNSFLSISGSDRMSFLQGLISNDVKKLKSKNILYTSLLTPQGKILFDFFIIDFEQNILIECSKKKIDQLRQRLLIFKLRSKIEISSLYEKICFIVNKDHEEQLKILSKKEEIILNDDPRFDMNFLRVFSTKTTFFKIVRDLKLDKMSNQEYEELRLKNTIPDFCFDSDIGKSTLLELRFDELNGIDWNKGCFMGQELTARTKYRGKTKRKIFGVKFFGKIKEKSIFYQKKLVGELKSYNNNFGIAIMKNEEALDSIKKQEYMFCGNVKVIPFNPKWI